MITYRQPFSGEYGISQRFGETTTDPNGHTGIDYLCPLGTEILASADGQVIFADFDKTGYGLLAIISHADGRKTYYAHLSFVSVRPWEKVRQGQLIGYSGSTGNSTGPHLHFEIRGADGKPVDPMTLLMTVDDSASQVQKPAPKPKPLPLKEADAFTAGDLVKVRCTLGVKGFYSKAFADFTTYPQGTPFYFTGETAVRKDNGLTYMRVVPATFSVWIAVHDNDVQLLDG